MLWKQYHVEPLEARVERPVSEPPGAGTGPRDQNQLQTEPAPARAPGDETPHNGWVRKSPIGRH